MMIPAPIPQPENRSFVIFDPVTGKVLSAGGCDGVTFDTAYATRTDCLPVPVGAQTLDSYVDLSLLMVRPKLPSQVTVDGLMLRNVPVPSVILIEGVPYENDEPEVELEFDMPGQYQIVVKSVRELDGVFQVTSP